jgi:putative membrane protein
MANDGWPAASDRPEGPNAGMAAATAAAIPSLTVTGITRLPGATMRLLVTWLINAATLFALPYLLSTVFVEDFTVALIAALILGLVNTLIRPLLVLLTLPVTVITLGLFIFVINGLMFWIVANFVSGFYVASFGSAILAALLYSVISWLLSALLLKKE